MIALVAASLALPLQVLGYATTCTMGDSDSALAGSLYSLPLLILCLTVLLRAVLAGAKKPMPRATGLVLLSTMVLTFSIWFNTLVFGTPCGEEFAVYLEFGNQEDHLKSVLTIVAGYLILPVINIALCLVVFLRTRRLA